MRKQGEGTTLVETAVEQIIQLILDQDMQAGDRLPSEHELAQRLGIGRSTLREATRRLAARGILQVQQGSGTYVSQRRGVPEDPLGLTFLNRDPALALELSDLRIMLEPNIAAMAARNASEAQLEELSARCAAVEEQIRLGLDYSDADMALHNWIAECSGNSVLCNLIPIIISGVKIAILTTGDEYRSITYLEHRKIVAAIQRRDERGAQYAMLNHLNTSREHFITHLPERHSQKG